MKARILANLLLEMNILNTKDVVREIDRIAARVYDPRAKAWVKRVAKYFILNIDELMDREATLRPEPNPRQPYYYDPQKGWTNTERMRIPDFYVLQNKGNTEEYWTGDAWGPSDKAKKYQGDETNTVDVDGNWINLNTLTAPDIAEEWVYKNIHKPDWFLGKLASDYTVPAWGPLDKATVYPSPVDTDGPGDGEWVKKSDLDLATPSSQREKKFAKRYGFSPKDRPGTFYTKVDVFGEGGKTRWTDRKDSAWASSDPEELKDIEMALGGPDMVNKVPLEQHHGESRSERMLQFIMEADAEGERYRTMLHTRPEWSKEEPGWGKLGKSKPQPPLWQRAREQSFQPFNPKKAKAKPLYGEAPGKKELQPWMLGDEGEPKDLQYFDPWNISQQELWQVINDIADWFNYLYSQVRAASRKDEMAYQKQGTNLYLDDAGEWGTVVNAAIFTPDEIEAATVPKGGTWVNPASHRAKESDAYLDRLRNHTKNNVDAFRDVVTDAAEFKSDVQNNPTKFMPEVKQIARVGNLSLKRSTSFNATCGLHSRPYYGKASKPTWCVNMTSYYNQYSAQGPLYWVDKEQRPYVLVHFPSSQAKLDNNENINEEIAQEIAPLFVNKTTDFTTEMLTQAAANSSPWGAADGSTALAKAILALRKRR